MIIIHLFTIGIAFQITVGADPLINYECPPNQVLIVHSKTANYIKMHCGRPSVCGQEKTCSSFSPDGSECRGKGTYLESVKENSDRSTVARCCNYQPISEYHITDHCSAQEIYDKTNSADWIATSRDSIPRSTSSSTSSPIASSSQSSSSSISSTSQSSASITTTIPTTLAPQATTVKGPHLIVNNYGSSQATEVQTRKPPITVTANRFLFGLDKNDDRLMNKLVNLSPDRNIDPRLVQFLRNGHDQPNQWRRKRAIVIKSVQNGPIRDQGLIMNSEDELVSNVGQYGSVDMRLFKLTDLQKPVELVKAILKIPNGYRVVSCKIVCANASSTSSTSPATSTSSPATSSSPQTSSSAAPSSSSPTTPLAPTSTNWPPVINCYFISPKSAEMVRNLSENGVLRQDAIPGFTEDGRYCVKSRDIGCLEKCLSILQLRLKNSTCNAETSDCICDQDIGDRTIFKQNMLINRFSPYDPNCYAGQFDPQILQPTQRPVLSTTKKFNDVFVPPNGACFPSDATVSTKRHGRTKMIDLRTGDEVLVLTNTGKATFEKVEWFYHRDTEKLAKFVSITTKSGKMIKMTENHLLPLIDCAHAQSIIASGKLSIDEITQTYSKFARKAQLSDCVLAIDNDSAKSIIIVDPIEKIDNDITSVGIFSPITSGGSILVDGVHASCYSTVENHMLQKALHSFVIGISKSIDNLKMRLKSIIGVFYDIPTTSADFSYNQDIPVTLRYMLEVARVVLPSDISF